MELRGNNIPFDGKIYKTDDPSIFVTTNWNRAVDSIRLKKIKNSILKVGYIPSPIIVNERMEIIDGQGRVEVAKELGLPIWYIIVPGIGRDECTSMNNSMTNWKTLDYIHSYASDGIPSYIWLEALCDKYVPSISYQVIVACITGLMGSNFINKKIVDGRFEVTKKDFEEADARLSFLSQFKETYSKCAQKTLLQRCLLTAYEDPDCDNADMISKLNAKHKVGGYGNTDECLDYLSDVYNYQKSTKYRIDLKHFNKFVMAEKVPGYQKKWGEAS